MVVEKIRVGKCSTLAPLALNICQSRRTFNAQDCDPEQAMASSEKNLRELEGSKLLAPDFPRRRLVTHAQWAAMSDGERRDAGSAARIAIRRASNSRALVDAIKEIGSARQTSAVPVLAKLWSDCALLPVRQAAGHALRSIGTEAARSALEAMIEDADHLSVFLAVRAVFDANPSTAFDRLAGYFDPQRIGQPGGCKIPQEVLGTFGPAWNSARKPKGVEWIMGEQHWFGADQRWMELCVRLRRDVHLGRSARAVLRVADKDRVRTTLSQARAQEGPRMLRSHGAASGDLVARYRRGEHEAVWRELRAHEAIDADCRAEALAVAAETMTRVARCADRLAERLASRGWTALSGRLRSPPAAGDSSIMADLEGFTIAPLPPALRAFWETVGGVDFVWDYRNDQPAPDLGPDLPMVEMDPLYVAAPRDVAALLAEWEERRSTVDPDLDDPCKLDLAPDYLHKANISGGAPYGIELPYLGADPVFVHEEHGLGFVDYLRLAFRWGGFPRLERHAHDADVRKFVADMTRDLETF
jgi:hypothetical protein